MINNFHAFPPACFLLTTTDFVVWKLCWEKGHLSPSLPPSIVRWSSLQPDVYHGIWAFSFFFFSLLSFPRLGHRGVLLLQLLLFPRSFFRGGEKKANGRSQPLLAASWPIERTCFPPLFSFLPFLLSSPEMEEERRWIVNGSRPDWKLCSKANGLVNRVK